VIPLQKLAFEKAWDKTIAEKDRTEIERVFSENKHADKESHNAIVLRTALNHKKELLVTVLVNNYLNEPLSLRERKIIYRENGVDCGEMESPYALEIPAQTSMPWTFIFPLGYVEGTSSRERGELTII
jgi:SLAP domain-containing protein